MTTTRATRTVLATAALAAALALGACAADDDSGSADSVPAVADEELAAPEIASDVAGRDVSGVGDNGAAAQPDQPEGPAVISKGSVSLRSDDVAETRFDVQQIVDTHDGSITQQETTTDDDGALATARMVLRIPSEDFAETVAELEEIAELTGSTTGSDDVTTQVIDVEARIRAQRKSVARVETLLAEATTIQQIMAVESELSRRQAELDSLTSQQQWLADQTSLATITVHVKRAETSDDDTDDAAGFLGGLRDGWDSLVGGVALLLTALGYALPWLVLLALVALPLRWWLRSARRRRTGPAADAGAAT